MTNYTKFKDGDLVRLKGAHIWGGKEFRNVPDGSAGVVDGKYAGQPGEPVEPGNPAVVVRFTPGGSHWVSESALESAIEPASDFEVAEAIRSILGGSNG